MGKWRLCKITIEAELEGRLETLVLGPEALENKYIGLGWGNIQGGVHDGKHLFEPISTGYGPDKIRPAFLSLNGRHLGDDAPALLLKEPNCCVDLWP